MDFLVAFLVKDGPLILGGMFGGALRWAFLKAKFWDGLSNMLVGAILGYYVSPYAVPLMAPGLSGLTSDLANVERLSALIIGIVGIGFIGLIIDVFKNLPSQPKQGPRVDPAPPADPGE
jgi:hypothetical protein